MADHRLNPRGIKPSTTDGDSLQTIGGVAAWGPAAASGVESVSAGTGITVDNTDPANPIVAAIPVIQLVPLTTVIGGVPDLVWDADNQLVFTEAT